MAAVIPGRRSVSMSASRAFTSFAFTPSRRQATTFLALNLWSVAPTVLFRIIIAKPLAWLNGKRLVFGAMRTSIAAP